LFSIKQSWILNYSSSGTYVETDFAIKSAYVSLSMHRTDVALTYIVTKPNQIIKYPFKEQKVNMSFFFIGKS